MYRRLGFSLKQQHTASAPCVPVRLGRCRYEPQHLSNTLWALAAAGVSPDDTWLEEYLTVAYTALGGGAVGARAYGSGSGRLQPQHLANVLWGLERLGVRPDEVGRRGGDEAPGVHRPLMFPKRPWMGGGMGVRPDEVRAGG